MSRDYLQHNQYNEWPVVDKDRYHVWCGHWYNLWVETDMGCLSLGVLYWSTNYEPMEVRNE